LIEGKAIPGKWASKPRSKSRRRPAEGLVGKSAPGFSITTLEQKPLGDSEFGKYKATVLNFVAPNCGFCKRQVPNVEKVRQEYEAKGIRFVNVAQKMRKEYSVEETEKIFKQAGSNLELATDFTNSVGQKYLATSFPTMVVVDGAGKIAAVNIGAKPNIDTILKGQLDKLIK
jgi:thiol-disulfide isomerase/thioredoxin